MTITPRTEVQSGGQHQSLNQEEIKETIAHTPLTSNLDPRFAPPENIGEIGILGPFRILRELGHGGMGAVYEAIDTRLDRPIALKVMLSEYASKAIAKERFLREARTAAKISHENIVPIFEADEVGGTPYIVMKLLQGMPLNQYLKEHESIPVSKVVQLAIQIATGLSAAHQIGLVHRDIKPANLWLESPGDRIILLDFGLTKPLDTNIELTNSGVILGTPAYMSPEQARGETIDQRSDLFSLGIILYRLVAGKLPFHGSTTLALFAALDSAEPVPVQSLNPSVPDSLAQIIHRLLNKNPKDRIPSAIELIKQLTLITYNPPDLAASGNIGTMARQNNPGIRPASYPVSKSTETKSLLNFDFDSTDNSTQDSSNQRNSSENITIRSSIVTTKKRTISPAFWWGLLGIVIVVGTITLILKKAQKGEQSPRPIEQPQSVNKIENRFDKSIVLETEREVAKYILSLGGSIEINQESSLIRSASELPSKDFSLTTIDFSGNNRIDDSKISPIKNCSELRKLILYDTPVTDSGLTCFRGSTRLTYLDLGRTRISDLGLENFANCKDLIFISLNGTKITSAGLANFANCQKIEFLGLTGTEVTDDGLNHFKDCVFLKNLGLNGTLITDKGLKNFHNCQQIYSLDLSKTAITDSGVENFKNFTELTYLDLSGTQISSKSLAQLNQCQKITFLSLAGTKISDASFNEFQLPKGLTRLQLDDTSITDLTLQKCQGLPSLLQLGITGTKVSESAVRQFHIAKPNCTIEYNGGTLKGK